MSTTPRILFENFFAKPTATVSLPGGEGVAGWPIENLWDWRLGTPYRFRFDKADLVVDIEVDLGSGNDLEADTFAWGGTNFWGENLGSSHQGNIRVQYSDNGSAWTEQFISVVWAAAPNGVHDGLPRFVHWSGAGAHRYWRVRLAAVAAAAADPQFAIMTLGRALSLEGLDPATDPHSIEIEAETVDNENGDFLGTNVVHRKKRVMLDYSRAGLSRDEFFRPASGVDVDTDFRAHLLAALPFWFLLDDGSSGSGSVTPQARAWLAESREWSMPPLGLLARRAFRSRLELYREVA